MCWICLLWKGTWVATPLKINYVQQMIYMLWSDMKTCDAEKKKRNYFPLLIIEPVSLLCWKPITHDMSRDLKEGCGHHNKMNEHWSSKQDKFTRAVWRICWKHDDILGKGVKNNSLFGVITCVAWIPMWHAWPVW